MTDLRLTPQSAPRRGRAPALTLALATALAFTGTAAAKTWVLTVRGGPANAGETPVLAALTAEVPPGVYALQGSDDATRARVFRDAGTTYVALVLKPRVAGAVAVVSKPGAAGAGSRFTFDDSARGAPAAGGVTLREDGPDVEILLGGKAFTTHRAGDKFKPYDFPLIGPTGEPYTRAYPMRKDVAGEDRDHNHQRSFWFTHGSVNGVDFWAADTLNVPKPTYGSIKETARTVVASGPAVGVLRTADDWLGPDGKKVCSDERVLRVYETAPGSARVLDFDVTVKADAGPVTFGDTKEGTFGLRLASSMDVNKKTGGRITNAEGLHDAAAWGKASPWVDYTGPVAGKTVGVAILNHPESFRYPTTWHVRDYGLFAANPFGWHDFGRKESGAHAVPAGGSVRFRYRVVLHEGDTASARVAEAFRAYAETPAVEVKAE